jgi:hypothetical protein
VPPIPWVPPIPPVPPVPVGMCALFLKVVARLGAAGPING